MYFNADRKAKEELFNFYKKEREESEKRRKDERVRRIEQERDEIDKVLKINQKENSLKRVEKRRKYNEAMKEYHTNFDKRDRKVFTKHHDVNINNIRRNENYRYDNYIPDNKHKFSHFHVY
jgi:hypothetical protein